MERFGRGGRGNRPVATTYRGRGRFHPYNRAGFPENSRGRGGKWYNGQRKPRDSSGEADSFSQPQSNKQNKQFTKSLFSCDTCDRSFPNEEVQAQHFAEHVTCNLDGCTFTAHPKVLLKHIDMQHANNLFKRIQASDPDDVKKWIEDRKAKYPTAKNQERKFQELQERYSRGERLPFQHKDERRKTWKKQEATVPENDKVSSQSPAIEVNSCPTDSLAIAQPPETAIQSGVVKTNRRARDPRPKKLNTPFLYSDEKPAQVPKNYSPEIVSLDNFYSKIRVTSKRKLKGVNLINWNAQTLKVSNRIAATGLTMKYLMENMNIDFESEDEDEGKSPEVSISDEEDGWDDDGLEIPANERSKKCEETENKVSGGLGPALGLVAYSDDSDSEDEAPEEIANCRLQPPPQANLSSTLTASNEEAPTICVPNPVFCDTKLDEVCNQAKTKDKLDEVDPHYQSEGRVKDIRHMHKNSTRHRPFEKHGPIRRRPRMSKFLRKLLGTDIRKERNQILQVCRYICDNNFFEETQVSKEATSSEHGLGDNNAACAIEVLQNEVVQSTKDVFTESGASSKNEIIINQELPICNDDQRASGCENGESLSLLVKFANADSEHATETMQQL